ncbi:LytTR family DNA-binding domain-containing protein [Pedobacter sp. BMA]|uniref:LytR/AlgR family response regulator transcription factor n=1 Tax=Pedobacter sp. BMA TaxID=1663685 RepID=UPI00064A3C7F|nr:LytTR family DNA-binding domain-containing protein [Pedobacter sp. BMA]KLT67115.1 hypothetical protein AB669_04305 [Pedobacter sp. BMA]
MELSSIIIDDEPHAITDLNEIIEVTPDVFVEKTFTNVSDAILFLRETGKVNVIFCDISMPIVGGLEAAPLLNEYCDFLVYVTAHRFHGPETYEADASGYLMKPVRYDKFVRQIKVLSKAKEDEQFGKDEKVLFVKGDDKNSMLKIFYDDIIYIEALENYINIHTTKGEKITYIQLKGLEQKLLKKETFFRVAKSTIISVNFLEKIEGYRALMTDGMYFNIGKVYRPAIREFIKKNRLN